jgi:hypothetical protein
VTQSCSDDGGIGTLFVVPSGGFDVDVGIRATLGVTADADQCTPPEFAGCVVARRSLEYTPHHRLVLPISLTQACVGHPCDPSSTCVGGVCVDAGVPECVDDTCNVADAGSPPPPPPLDGGACTPIAAVKVATVTGYVPQPHVMTTSTGYAVAYETAPATSARDIDAITIDALGNVATTQKIGAAGANLGTSAVGANGTHYALVAFDQAQSLYASDVPIDGTGSAKSADLPASSVAPFGMLWDSSASTYRFLAVGTAGDVELGTFAPGDTTLTIATFDSFTSASALELSQSGGRYFGTYVNQTTSICRVVPCTSLQPSMCGGQTSINNCTAVSVAAQGSTTLAVQTDTQASTLVYTFAAPATKVTIGTIDPSRVVVLPHDPSAFLVFYGLKGAVTSQPFTSTLVTAPSTALTSPTGIPARFDVVRGLPTNAYAIAYWDASTSAIWFMLTCE